MTALVVNRWLRGVINPYNLYYYYWFSKGLISIVISYLCVTLAEWVLVDMDSGRGKEKELAKQLISLDLDEGIRIEQKSQDKKLFINKNACGNFVVQFIDTSKNQNSEINNIQYFTSDAEVLEFVKTKFDKNFSASLY